MSMPPKLASMAHLIADPTRAAMLMALAAGQAQPAGVLAREVGVTAQTASAHLAKLLAGGLLAVSQDGRERRYRLAGPQVALALETLATLAAALPASPVRSPQFARRCYDHLAGRLGVALTQALQQRGVIAATADRFEVTAAGWAWFTGLGLDISACPRDGAEVARPCLDWSEHQHHLAGPLGAEWLRWLCASGWLRPSRSARLLQVTPRGWDGLRHELGIERDRLLAEAAA